MWKFNEVSEDHQKLLNKGIIDIATDNIDGEAAIYVRQSLHILTTMDTPDITLIITSDGGEVEAGLAIYDMIRLYPGKVTGRVVGYARSMAVIILQACDVRECTQHSLIKIHNILRDKVSLSSLRSKHKLDKLYKDMECRQASLYRVLSQRSGQSISSVRKACGKEENWTAAEALRFGLIDKIV